MDADPALLRAVGNEVILDSWPSCAKQSKIYQLNFRHAAYFCNSPDVCYCIYTLLFLSIILHVNGLFLTILNIS